MMDDIRAQTPAITAAPVDEKKKELSSSYSGLGSGNHAVSFVLIAFSMLVVLVVQCHMRGGQRQVVCPPKNLDMK